MNLEKRNTFIILAILTLICCIIFIPVEREIDQEFICYASHQDDPDYHEKVSVTFHGTYIDYLFLTDRFEGYIDVSDFEYLADEEGYLPEGAEPLDIEIGTKEGSDITYRVYDENHMLNLEHRSRLWSEEDLDTFYLSYYIPIPHPDNHNFRIMQIFLTYPEDLSWDEAESRVFFN